VPDACQNLAIIAVGPVTDLCRHRLSNGVNIANRHFSPLQVVFFTSVLTSVLQGVIAMCILRHIEIDNSGEVRCLWSSGCFDVPSQTVAWVEAGCGIPAQTSALVPVSQTYGSRQAVLAFGCVHMPCDWCAACVPAFGCYISEVRINCAIRFLCNPVVFLTT